MAESTIGILESVRHGELQPGKEGRNGYRKVDFTVNDLKGSKFVTDGLDFPEEGANVKVEYVPNGKFLKILSVKATTGSMEIKTTTNKDKVTEVKGTTTSYKGKTSGDVEVGAFVRMNEASKEQLVNYTKSSTSKDISMEVSGILQSLIGTGMYNDKSEKGIFIKEELLETHLRLALSVKRRVAKELEKGSLS